MFYNKKAIFWDNDGILVDTEKYYFEANRQILGKVGLDLTKGMYVDLFLIQSRGAWHLLDPVKYPDEVVQNLKKERDLQYQEFLLTKDILMEGIEEIVERLSHNYRMSIVTSSKTMHFNAIHSRTHLLKYFEFAITPDDYTKYKPDPEPYLKALQRMGISATESIAIEDSRRGLIAAKSAGLDCIVVKNELTANSDFAEADCVLSNIHELVGIL